MDRITSHIGQSSFEKTRAMNGSLKTKFNFQELHLAPNAPPTLVAGFSINRFSAFTNGVEGEWVPYFSLVVNDKLNRFGVCPLILSNRGELEIFLTGLSDIITGAIKLGLTQNDLQILINSFGNQLDPTHLRHVMDQRINQSSKLQKAQHELEKLFREYK